MDEFEQIIIAIRNLQAGVREMLHKVEDLQKENERLKKELEKK